MATNVSPRLMQLSTELDADGTVLSSLEAGRTLPSKWYTDAEVFELEQKLIFARSWDFVGTQSQVERPGDFFTCVSAGTPIVVVRDKDDSLRAFLNSCRHRKNPVAVGAGNRPLLVCRYHAWSYGLDGSLKAAPRSSEDPDFCRAALSLEPVKIETLGDMIFVNTSGDAPPLRAVLGPIPELSRKHGIPLERAKFRQMRQIEVDANWKIVWDNNSECYHCPTIHASWYKEASLGPESVIMFPVGPFHFQHRMTTRKDAPVDNHFFCWPTFTLATDSASGPGFAARTQKSKLEELGHLGYFFWRWIPLAADRTRVELHLFTEKATDQAAIDEWYAALFQVLQEDKEICESVQSAHRYDVGEPGTLVTKIDSEFQIQCWELLVHRALTKPHCDLYAPLITGIASDGPAQHERKIFAKV